MTSHFQPTATSSRFRSPALRAAAISLLLLIALGACSSANEAPAGFGQQYDDEVHGANARQYQDNVRQLLVECARLNGLEDWQPEVAEPRGLDPAPGLSGRERVETIGSGIVASFPELQAFRAAAQSGETPPRPPIDPAINQVINIGPVQTPNGNTFERGGCQSWAVATIEESASFREAAALSAEFGQFQRERLDTMPEVLELTTQWSRCMADEGYQGLEKRDEPIPLIDEQLMRHEAGEISYEQALAFDIAISVASFDCNELINPELSRIRDEMAWEFANRDD